MKKYFYILVLLTGFWSCTPSEIKVPESAKNIDNYSRQFIDYVIAENSESAINMISPDLVNEQTQQFIANTGRNINHEIVRNIRVVEYASATTMSNGKKIHNYRISYEYTFDKGNILFYTTVKEENDKMLIIGFNGEFLQAPLSELTKFTFAGKTGTHYIVFLWCILVPLFVFTTFIIMLFSKISVKKKIIWGIVILLISFPRFTINWNTGDVGFNLLNISLFGAGFGKANLYSAWILAFNIPIGAIIYWITQTFSAKRQKNKIKLEEKQNNC